MAAYFVWHNRLHQPEMLQQYLSKVLDTMAPYHPEIVVFDEHAQAVEGSAPGPRTIVIKFDSRETAMAWYNCAEYQEVLPLSLAAVEGFGVLVDGYSPPGP